DKAFTELLSKSECPVLVAPETYSPVDEVVFAFDGSASASFAIRQFHYLLPSFGHKTLHVLQVGTSDNDGKGENNDFPEWLNMHYPKHTFVNLTGDAREMLFEYFMANNGNNNKMLVAGSFGRSLLSLFFRPSTAQLVLKAVDVPVFIAHR